VHFSGGRKHRASLGSILVLLFVASVSVMKRAVRRPELAMERHKPSSYHRRQTRIEHSAKITLFDGGSSMLTKRKLALTLAFTVLVAVAFGVSCKNFFVDPTLSSVSVGPPTPTIETGNAGDAGTYVQMYATGVNNDGSNASNPSVAWTLTPLTGATTAASITTGGKVNALAVGTVKITATSTQNTAISGTQTVSVTAGCITSITLSPSSVSPLTTVGATDDLTATATTCTTDQDITDVAVWNSNNTSAATVSKGVVSAVATGTAVISASSGNINSTNTVTVTVNIP
jgi:hypothetical protein